MKKILRFWLPPVLWAAIIFLFSCLSAKPVSKIYWKEFAIKKTAHIVEYGIFTILLYRALKESGMGKKKAGIFAVLFSSFYGMTDEYHQMFTPGREPRIRDVIFDTIGSILAIYSIWRLLPKAPKKLKLWAKNLQLI